MARPAMHLTFGQTDRELFAQAMQGDLIFWHLPKDVAVSFQVLQQLFAAFLGMVLWDFISALPFDLALLGEAGWKNRVKLTSRLAYLTCRILSPAVLTLILIYISAPVGRQLGQDACAVYARTFNGLLVPLANAVPLVFIMRTLTLYEWQRRVVVPVLALWGIVFVLSCISLPYYGKGLDIPDGSGWCHYDTQRKLRTVYNVAYKVPALLQDVVIMLLTLHRLKQGGLQSLLRASGWRHFGMTSLSKILVTQGFRFFLLNIIVDVIFIIFYFHWPAHLVSYQVAGAALLFSVPPMLAGKVFRDSKRVLLKAQLEEMARNQRSAGPTSSDDRYSARTRNLRSAGSGAFGTLSDRSGFSRRHGLAGDEEHALGPRHLTILPYTHADLVSSPTQRTPAPAYASPLSPSGSDRSTKVEADYLNVKTGGMGEGDMTRSLSSGFINSPDNSVMLPPLPARSYSMDLRQPPARTAREAGSVVGLAISCDQVPRSSGSYRKPVQVPDSPNLTDDVPFSQAAQISHGGSTIRSTASRDTAVSSSQHSARSSRQAQGDDVDRASSGSSHGASQRRCVEGRSSFGLSIESVEHHFDLLDGRTDQRARAAHSRTSASMSLAASTSASAPISPAAAAAAAATAAAAANSTEGCASADFLGAPHAADTPQQMGYAERVRGDEAGEVVESDSETEGACVDPPVLPRPSFSSAHFFGHGSPHAS